MTTHETVRICVCFVLVGLLFTPMVLTVIRNHRACFTFKMQAIGVLVSTLVIVVGCTLIEYFQLDQIITNLLVIK